MIVNDYPHSPYAIAPYRDIDGPSWPSRCWSARASGASSWSGAGRRTSRSPRRTRPARPSRPRPRSPWRTSASCAWPPRAERVKAAAEVGRLLASTLDADQILDVIAEKCREILGAHGFGLFRFDDNGRLHYARGSGWGPSEFMREHTLALGEGVVGRAALERRSIQTVDLLT